MRRLYDSSDDRDPALPKRPRENPPPQSFRSLNSSSLSTLLLPVALRRRALSIDVAAPDREIPAGAPVPFTVTIRNPWPVPITLETRSPITWTWHVDGRRNAADVQLHEPPGDRGVLQLSRGDRRTIRKRWNGYFQVGEHDWEPAEPGAHTIEVAVNVPKAAAAGLTAETTVTIVDE